jgi:hypothetical protein
MGFTRILPRTGSYHHKDSTYLFGSKIHRGWLGNGDYTDISTLLQPLKLLRSIENFQLRDASIFEIPDEIEQDENFTISESQLNVLDAVEQVKLTQLAQSNTPLECTFELYPVLLRYAQ